MYNFLLHNDSNQDREGKNVKTNLQRRVDKLQLTKNNVLITVIEAVVNAIQSIAEAGILNGKIRVILHRDESQLRLDQEDKTQPPIVKIEIEDNGIGFTKENTEAFLTLDTGHKEKLGGRGVGRLQWLKVFTEVQVSSCYEEDSLVMKRNFSFDIMNEVKEIGEPQPCQEARHTTVKLIKPRQGCENRFKNCSTDKVADYIKENCIYELLGNGPKLTITVSDPCEHNSVDVVELAEQWVQSSQEENVNINGREFNVTHIMLSDTNRSPAIVYYGNERPVRNDELSKLVPELVAALKNENQGYMCQVCGAYLDDHVTDTRDSFDIAEGCFDQLYHELTFSDIQSAVVERINVHMKELIEKQKEKAYQRAKEYVDNKNPRYRAVLSEIAKRARFVSTDTDSEIEVKLHGEYAKIDLEILENSKKLLNQLTFDEEINEEFEKKIEKFAELESKFRTSDLVGYVLRRRAVLEILQKIIGRKDEKNYYAEKNIHQLIMPMKSDSDDVTFERSNFWIIDERLAFHRYLASDLPMKQYKIINTQSEDRPDILRFYDNPMYVSDKSPVNGKEITVIEFKKPMRPDVGTSNDDPVQQTLDYLDKLREGELETVDGRPIPESKSIPCYCYIICDITANMGRFLRTHNYARAADGRYFFYHSEEKAYIEVVGYDTLLKMAHERNYAFFDVLGVKQL